MADEQHHLVFQHSHMPGGDPETFQDQLRGWFKSSPWFAISAVIHAIAILLMFNIPWQTTKTGETVAIQATLENEDVEVIPPEPPEPEEEVEEIEEVIEDPVITEEETEEVLEEMDTDENPFDSNSINDVIGVGGGAGGGFGKKYRRRAAKGGGKAAQRAVEWGLEWLYKHQHEDGHWGADSFSDMCETNICGGRGNPTVDTGVTGLALLAFLGANHTMDTGKYKSTVKKGLRWLKNQQGIEVDGLFGDRAGSYFMYNHALAALAMCEGYGLSNAPVLRRPAQKGLDFIAQSRNPYKVWRYAYPPTGRDEDNDMSVTGWMVFAMASAGDFDLNVDTAAQDASRNFIDEMTDTATWRTGYTQKGGLSAREPGDEVRWPAENIECMTAVGMLCRMLLAEDKDIEPDTVPALKGGARLLLQKLPRWEEPYIDYYYWYYGSYAMYQMSGTYWEKWQKAMEKTILEHQETEGDEKGSWDPEVDPWGDVGGRVYSTALSVLCLEVYYRYDKILGSR